VVSIDLIRPLLIVVVDNNVEARLGALRLGGSERVSAGAWFDRSSPFVDWRIDSLIALALVLPTVKVGGISSG
jgi:hypothetical protein